MAKKQLARKRTLKKVVAKAVPSVPKVEEDWSAIREPEVPEVEAPTLEGDLPGGQVKWRWFSSSDGGHLEAASERNFSLAIDFGRPVTVVGASINNGDIVPKNDGANKVYVRCAGGALSIEVLWVKESFSISVDHWDGP